MSVLSTAPLAELQALGVTVDTDPRRLAEYSYDASHYRLTPLGVIFPVTAQDVAITAEFCHRNGIPLISRGGGTSMSGNSVGPGLVLDFSPHMNTVVDIDTVNRTAKVLPGMVMSEFARAVRAATQNTLTFAPDPSSWTRATLGGAIGNDACGNHSVRYGRTSDHVLSLDVITAEGLRLTATPTGLHATIDGDAPAARRATEISSELQQLSREYLKDFRLELGRIPRQVSGYHLSHLLPENRFNVARALVGSEGTCVVVVAATVKLVPVPSVTRLLSLGYHDVVDAAKDVTTILEFKPAALEGIDESIVKTMQMRRGPDSVLGLPEGKAWLYVELDAEEEAELDASSEKLLSRLQENGRLIEGRAVPDSHERATLWRVREEGAGLATRPASGGASWGGWEDAAVAPENLADYLAEFLALLDSYGLSGVMYGHFGAGCIHVRITFDMRSETGRQQMADFIRDAAALVVRHGGSLSGEHGDGRARSELLPIMYSTRMLGAFARFKDVWDPQRVLNPGSLVDPDKLTEHLWLEGVPNRQWRTSFDLRPVHGHDVQPGTDTAASGRSGSDAVLLSPQQETDKGLDPFIHAVQSCVGVGKCRTDTGGVMCPSYRATRDEKDSTRGRSRVLQEMVRGSSTVQDGWKSEEAREVLDLCLSCKACSTDCPVGVDMATYKAEFFDHYYEGRFRPLAHYSLGWLPRWLKLTGRLAPLVNLALASPLRSLIARAGGITPKRALPKFASNAALRRELSAAAPAGAAQISGQPSDSADVVLFIDSFTRGFRPKVAGAAQRVLQGAGKTVQCSAESCCALTWISTGQLGTAQKILTKTAATLDDGTQRPIVVIEPSCAAALKEDLPRLVPTDAARRVASRVSSFAGAVTTLAQGGWRPQWPEGKAPSAVTVQTHCHEYSVFGDATQRSALKAVGVLDVREATGCCGVAGNFGYEPSHYEISMQVAEQALIPALYATEPQTPVLTDGFSCLMQVAQLEPDRQSLHLAQLLDPGPAAGEPAAQETAAEHNPAAQPNPVQTARKEAS